MCERLPHTVAISQDPDLGSAPGLGQFQQLDYALDQYNNVFRSIRTYEDAQLQNN